MPNSVPSAPWKLKGQAAAWLEGFGLRLWVRYSDSPVGAYDEWALVKLTIRGPSVVEMWVDSENSRRGGRGNWGFPKELAQFKTDFRGPRGFGISFPIRARFWTAQSLDGKTVKVPGEIVGRARLAFRGRQVAICLEEFSLKVEVPVLPS